jgi:hypothetical protein
MELEVANEKMPGASSRIHLPGSIVPEREGGEIGVQKKNEMRCSYRVAAAGGLQQIAATNVAATSVVESAARVES